MARKSTAETLDALHRMIDHPNTHPNERYAAIRAIQRLQESQQYDKATWSQRREQKAAKREADSVHERHKKAKKASDDFWRDWDRMNDARKYHAKCDRRNKKDRESEAREGASTINTDYDNSPMQSSFSRNAAAAGMSEEEWSEIIYWDAACG